jgi:hypothetical protein
VRRQQKRDSRFTCFTYSGYRQVQLTKEQRAVIRRGHFRIVGILAFLVAVVLPVLPSSVWAGPPFATDDPFPLPLHTGELYLFATGGHGAGETIVDAAPGIEANFSFIQNSFLHLVAPLTLNHPSAGPSNYGVGDVETGFKWRFLEQSNNRPEIGVFPLLVLPTGDEERGLGSEKTKLFLPVWLGKEMGPWTSYGGGGYWINPGDGNRDWWFTGLLVQRQVTDRLFLGGEVFHQTADADGASASTGVDLGGGFAVAGPYQVLFSAGRNIQNVDVNQFSFYGALYRTF